MPSTVHKFRSNGDHETAALLENVVYKEVLSGRPLNRFPLLP
jgi:hypothetical protein